MNNRKTAFVSLIVWLFIAFAGFLGFLNWLDFRLFFVMFLGSLLLLLVSYLRVVFQSGSGMWKDID